MSDADARMPAVVRVLIVLGAVFAAFGLVAGHLNRELLDGPTFAAHVDEIRRDDDVAAELGVSISDQLVRQNPDLVAIRPLVESVATRVAGGDLLSGPTRLAAQSAHRALTEGDADSIALRLTDTAAVVTAVLAAVAPERAPVTSDVSVTLASIGDQAFAETTIAIARALGVLAWLLPALALVCFVAAIALSPSRWRSAASIGRSLLWAAGTVGVVMLVGGFLIRLLDERHARWGDRPRRLGRHGAADLVGHRHPGDLRTGDDAGLRLGGTDGARRAGRPRPPSSTAAAEHGRRRGPSCARCATRHRRHRRPARPARTAHRRRRRIPRPPVRDHGDRPPRHARLARPTPGTPH